MSDSEGPGDGFEAFYRRVERRLVVALGVRYGPEVGREAAIEALAWAWEHWDRLAPMANPAGYLYRVGQTRARRLRPRPSTAAGPEPAVAGEVDVEPALEAALATLTARQRQVVVLAHGYGCTHRETGALLGISPASVQNHAERGLAKLRRHLEAAPHG